MAIPCELPIQLPGVRRRAGTDETRGCSAQRQPDETWSLTVASECSVSQIMYDREWCTSSNDAEDDEVCSDRSPTDLLDYVAQFIM